MNLNQYEAIHRHRKPDYKLELRIYPSTEYGGVFSDEPTVVYNTSKDLLQLKSQVEKLILSIMSVSECDWCFTEMVITENEKFFDYDEAWFYIDRVRGIVSMRG